MSDLRLCVLCNELIDVEDKSVTVIAPRRGGNGKRTTVLDSQGRVHALQTKRLTAIHLQKVKPEEKMNDK